MTISFNSQEIAHTLAIMLGILVCAVVLLFTLVGLTYLLTLAFILLQTGLHSLLALYSSSDSLIKLAMWLVLLLKVLPVLYQGVRKVVHHA